MPNDKGNPNIVEYGKDTRFGSLKNCPHKARTKALPAWSIRRAAGRLARHEFDATKIDQIAIEDVLQIFSPNGEPTKVSECLVATTFLRAMQDDVKALNIITLWIDGPLKAPSSRTHPRSLGT